MAELWPFIQSLVKKWLLEGRIFTFKRLSFPFEVGRQLSTLDII